MLLVATPQRFEITGVIRLLRACKDVESASARVKVLADVRGDGYDSVPSAFVSFSRERNKFQIIAEVAPSKLSDFLVRSQQASIGEQAAEEQLFIECSDIFKDSMHIIEGFVKRWFLFELLGLVDWRLKSNGLHQSCQDHRQVLAFMVVGGYSLIELIQVSLAMKSSKLGKLD